MNSIILKAGREKSLLRRHPWVFSGAIAQIQGQPQPGETVLILDSKRQTLAQGAFSDRSQIVARVWSFNPDEKIDASFFDNRVYQSLERRQWLPHTPEKTSGVRLINAESDGLAGITVDRYGEWLVGQFTSAGAQLWKKVIAEILVARTNTQGLLERTDNDVCLQEGLPEAIGPLAGTAPPGMVNILEHGVTYAVDPWQGHKTGFYLDQRDNRAIIRDICHGSRVLNAFSFSGGFGLNAIAAGAEHVVHLDSSKSLLAQAAENARLSQLPGHCFEYCKGNAFHKLREWRDQKRSFDVIVLDPPKLADTNAGLNRAARAYKDLNWLAFRLLAPGGRLLTFSCSGRMPADLFAKVVADAAIDANRNAVIQRHLGPPADHPVSLTFPEGRYLKGLMCVAD